NVSLPAKTNGVKVTVYDVMGKQMVKQSLINNTWVDLSDLTNGVYFVRIVDKNESTTIRVVKY
ncbi:MAG: T9SS type A sorting domain-containing protein, partial [Bacteroidia bacterium]